MALKIRKEGDNYNLPVHSLICDDVSDLDIILEEVEELIPYSECYVINTLEKYVLNSLGEWKKITTGDPGGSGGEDLTEELLEQDELIANIQNALIEKGAGSV